MPTMAHEQAAGGVDERLGDADRRASSRRPRRCGRARRTSGSCRSTVPSRPTMVAIDAIVDSAIRLRSSSGTSRPLASWIAACVSATIFSLGAPSAFAAGSARGRRGSRWPPSRAACRRRRWRRRRRRRGGACLTSVRNSGSGPLPCARRSEIMRSMMNVVCRMSSKMSSATSGPPSCRKLRQLHEDEVRDDERSDEVQRPQ